MRWAVELKRSASKELEQLPKRVQDDVVEALQVLRANPFTRLLDIKKLKGAEALYRLRLGDYRVVFEVVRKRLVVIVIKIGHRREIYRRR